MEFTSTEKMIPCVINFLSSNVSGCNPANDFFEITGEVQFTDAPTTGQLVISDCNGNSQTFDAPFTSPTSYVLDSIISDGTTTNCSVTAYFTDDMSCTLTASSFDYPASCMCFVDAGTFDQSINGNPIPQEPILLCYGDTLNIMANGDYTPPTDHSSVLPTITYDPGMWLLLYTCAPYILPPQDIANNDTCLAGIGSMNDQNWDIINTFGGQTTYWYKPTTMYSMQDGIYATTVNGGDLCFDLGPSYPVTFLDEVTHSYSIDCTNGTADITIEGGLPAYNGSDFTAQNLSPANASFSNSTTANGGVIQIQGLFNGDSWSFDVIDTNGCSITVSGTMSPDVTPSISAGGATTFCQGESVVLSSSEPTGNWWSTGDTTTSITVTDSDSYFVTYTDSNGCSVNSDTIDVTVNTPPSVTIGNLSDMCIYYPPHTLIEGSPAGGTYLGAGVSNGIFDPTVAGIGTHGITYKYVDTNGCSEQATSDLYVDECLSVESIDFETPVVYPNPIENVLTIEFSGSFSYKMIDVRGRIVINGNGNDTEQVNTANIESGIYVLMLDNEMHSTTTRLVKK